MYRRIGDVGLRWNPSFSTFFSLLIFSPVFNLFASGDIHGRSTFFADEWF